jgi:hypothetical protein
MVQESSFDGLLDSAQSGWAGRTSLEAGMPIDRARNPSAHADVEWLIEAALRHPLGVDYLRNGHLGSVAITFGCHAFTVVAARDFLNDAAAAPLAPAPARASSERKR